MERKYEEGDPRGERVAKVDMVTHDALAELERSMRVHPPFYSPHQAYALLLEEMDELWEEIKRKPNIRSRGVMRLEAVQIAALAMRFAIDLT